MPPRKKRAAPASKKAQPAAAHKAAAVKKAATARRGAQAAPVEPVGVTAPAVVAAPAPVPAKNQVEVEVNLHPTENGNIRLEFDIGRGDESANLSPKRTLRDAFLATCRLQGVEDAEVVKCTDPNGKAAASLTLGKVLGDTDDTFCLVTFRWVAARYSATARGLTADRP